MSEFQICACGSAPGYPHRSDCPRPLYNPTDAQFEAWEKDRLNMKTQHTPTPWTVQKEENTLDGITDLAIRFEGGKIANKTVEPFRVATINTAYFGAHESEAIANAEFIVHACNAHDELLAACKAVLAWIQDHSDEEWRHDHAASEEMLEIAIAKAEGK